MDLLIDDLLIPFEHLGYEEFIAALSRKLGVAEKSVKLVKILRKSLDIKDKNQFYYKISVVVRIDGKFNNKENYAEYTENFPPARKAKKISAKPVIIGFGPAGIFAALELIELGIKPVIFERGKKIEERSIDVHRFIEERKLNINSNIQFGEGGAGAYSDGKLFSRGRNNYFIDKVLKTFVRFGAPSDIIYAEKPHLGTDIICKIVRNMRKHIVESGGEIYFNSKITDILVSKDKVTGVVINGDKKWESSIVCLAIGHSARDTFEMLNHKGIVLEQKPISVGVRIEHPVEIINIFRYGEKYKNHSGLGAANYSFTYTDRKMGRTVNTFCMCPGGEIVNASSEYGMTAVNGMSYSARSSEFSNSALVVTCNIKDYRSKHPLAGIEFQKSIERAAFASCDGTWKAPAQNLNDFLCRRVSKKLNTTSFKMGIMPVDLNKIYPQFVCDMLRKAFLDWKKEYELFVSDYGLLIGPETRTSCPARILRNSKYESVSIKNLYPIGEGSGYTGGITSSAADAIKVIAANFTEE